jgi:hypothetical protein
MLESCNWYHCHVTLKTFGYFEKFAIFYQYQYLELYLFLGRYEESFYAPPLDRAGQKPKNPPDFRGFLGFSIGF